MYRCLRVPKKVVYRGKERIEMPDYDGCYRVVEDHGEAYVIEIDELEDIRRRLERIEEALKKRGLLE